MTKRRRCDEQDDGGTAEPQQRRLYLTCDDWESGYSIRKLSLPADDSGDGADEPSSPKLFWRVAAARKCPQDFASAFGTKIMGGDQIIDVRTRCVRSGPRSNYPAYPIYFPVGDDRVFALDSASLEICRFPPVQPDDPESVGDESDAGSDSDSEGEWSWHQLPLPPFARMDVASYAMHPDGDGHTILVSTKSGVSELSLEEEEEESEEEEEEEEEVATATFSFETGVSAWNYLSDWTLPFTGRRHYESELRALLGSPSPRTRRPFGYLYACDVPSIGIGNLHCPAPAWKRSREKVLSKNPADKHVSASLIYLGYRRKFCLVECVLVEEDKACQEVKEDKDGKVLPEKAKKRHMCAPTPQSLHVSFDDLLPRV